MYSSTYICILRKTFDANVFYAWISKELCGSNGIWIDGRTARRSAVQNTNSVLEHTDTRDDFYESAEVRAKLTTDTSHEYSVGVFIMIKSGYDKNTWWYES